METSCLLQDEEYNLPPLHITWTPMLYPSMLYQHKAEASIFHLAHKRSTGQYLPENLPLSSGPSKVSRIKHPQISGNFTHGPVDHDMSSGFDVWNMSAERSPLASTLTEDDILEMVLRSYLGPCILVYARFIQCFLINWEMNKSKLCHIENNWRLFFYYKLLFAFNPCTLGKI